VSLLVLARRPHLIGITDRRLMIWARPHEVRPAEDKDIVLDAPFDEITLEGVRAFSPMLQLRLATTSGRKIVAEFRPRDRKLGHRIARALRGEDAGEPPAPSSEVPAATT
jgi:hypothetical protein